MQEEMNEVQIVLPIISKDYIRDKHNLKEDECSLCYDVSDQIVKCVGPCQKIMCLECISTVKKVKNECPFRCCQIFQIQLIQNVKFSYDCPYFPHECKQAINSVAEFEMHCESCHLIPDKNRHQYALKNSYKCLKGHNLVYLTLKLKMQLQARMFIKQGNHESLGLKCQICQGQCALISNCFECDPINRYSYYCRKCRKLPCTKTQCPVGHTLISKPKSTLKNIICDFCNTNTDVLKQAIYEDWNCDFDICERCHAKLPETNPIQPLKNQPIDKYPNIVIGIPKDIQDRLEAEKQYIGCIQAIFFEMVEAIKQQQQSKQRWKQNE